MRMHFEIWDDETANRVGPSFATQAEAEALLADVLRVNGQEVTSRMAVIVWRETTPGEYDAETVLEGAEFVARVSAPA